MSLVTLPLVAPVLLGLVPLGLMGRFRFDYLMPFEVYPVTLAGIALLVWAAMRVDSHRRWVGFAVAGMIGGLVLASVAAEVTGIAHSDVTAAWPYVLSASLLGLSIVAQIALVVAGVLLVREAFSPHTETPPLTPAVHA